MYESKFHIPEAEQTDCQSTACVDRGLWFMTNTQSSAPIPLPGQGRPTNSRKLGTASLLFEKSRSSFPRSISRQARRSPER